VSVAAIAAVARVVVVGDGGWKGRRGREGRVALEGGVVADGLVPECELAYARAGRVGASVRAIVPRAMPLLQYGPVLLSCC